MILEIEFSKNLNISKYIRELQTLGDFIIDKNFVYLNSYQDISFISNKLPIVKCQYIMTSNYKNIPSSFSRKWCQELLYKQELLEFEKTPECQARLKYINEQLDILEKGGMGIVKEKESSNNS